VTSGGTCSRYGTLVTLPSFERKILPASYADGAAVERVLDAVVGLGLAGP
jgi:hypothetical protein